MSSAKSEGQIYYDRNVLALAFAAAMNDLATAIADPTLGAGWHAPDDEDDADADAWAIVQVLTPEGQVSWHVPRQLAEQSAVPQEQLVPWDGHGRDLKNERLKQYATGL